MTLLHLISSPEKINYGVWNVVLSVIPVFEKRFDATSLVFYPSSYHSVAGEFSGFHHFPLTNVETQIVEKYNKKDTIIISHGNWTSPTKWGSQLKSLGYRWVVIPHGMLEPWSMRHKWLKKKLYYTIYERPRLLNAADAIVAVGKPEYDNLRRVFGQKVVHIPNGISHFSGSVEKNRGKKIFLFLGRLHHKKGVLPLVKAWLGSSPDSNSAELWIAGPDEGELVKIEREIGRWAEGEERRTEGGEQGAESREQRAESGEEGERSKPACRRGREQGARSKGQEGSGEGIPTGNGQPTTDNRQRITDNRQLTTDNPQPATNTIKILGPIYGEEKQKALQEAHFFVLPSQSEGFPTSIIEAMTYGCIPIITEGCNFPEAFDNDVALKVKFHIDSVRQGLMAAMEMKDDELYDRARQAKQFVDEHYDIESVVDRQWQLYKNILENSPVPARTMEGN